MKDNYPLGFAMVVAVGAMLYAIGVLNFDWTYPDPLGLRWLSDKTTAIITLVMITIGITVIGYLWLSNDEED